MKSVEPGAPPRERPEKTRFKQLAVALGGVALLVGGLSLLTTKNDAGWTPLHEAAIMDAAATVKMLLENGADVNAKDNEGWTPLIWAEFKNADATTEVLHRYGARK